jgi:uncharacterized protein YbjT (DUF2867 family)
MTRTLVTGATGFVGSHLVSTLRTAGADVVAATRRPEAYPAADGVGVVSLDLDDASTIAPALDGVGIAYYLVHGMESSAFAERDAEAAKAFARAAEAAGTTVVYLGGLGDDASEHLASRHEVGRILRDTAGAIELRAAMVVGKGSASYEILRQLVHRLPVMVCPKWVDTRCQPIALDDVVADLVEAPTALERGQAYDIGGADVLTYREMLLAFARLTGRRRFIVSVPVLTPHLSSLWLGLVTDQPPSIARPLVEGLTAEVVVRDGDAIRARIPRQVLAFDEAVRRALIAS